MYKMIFTMVLFILSMLISIQGFAKDLGKIGTVYPIAEKDLMVLLKKRAADLQTNGGLSAMQNRLNDDVRKAMDRPPPVAGLQATLTPRTFLFDPTIQASRNITDAQNNMIIHEGQRINGLEKSSAPFTPMIFYNADRKSQAAWALQKDKALKGNDLLILVGGSVFDQMKTFQKSVYFDQGGLLTTRFGITHVPAVVTQKGNRFLIQEVLPE